MTLSRHIQILRVGIGASAAVLAATVAVSWKMLPRFPALVGKAQNRSEFLYIAEALNMPPEPYAAYVTVIGSLLFALAALIMVFYLFEKTQSVEVHLFIFFVFSFVFESARLNIPLCQEFGLPGFLPGLSARALVFFRLFGMFSLFAASLFSAGLKIEKEENIIFPLVIITLFLSDCVPINTFTYDTSLFLANGYPVAFRAMDYAVMAFTALSFLYAAWKRSLKDYCFVGLGAFLAFLGRNILLDADLYALAACGFAFLAAGSGFICVYLRRIYLWS
ncbi:MAG: hypothetical protein LBS82_06570 [Spirochaetaceae bacterium]|jgi:hypothetical protein|nr:hypothetical protein [Spirochaetaceae bacterium]